MIDYQILAGQMEAAGVHARLQEPLSRHTTFRIGGPARLFCLPASENALIAALELCRWARGPTHCSATRALRAR